MSGKRPSPPYNVFSCHAVLAALLLGASLSLGGCQTSSLSDMTASIGTPAALPKTDAEWQSYAEVWGKKYDAHPNDKTVAMNYARALRVLTRHPQAVAVLQSLAVKYPHDLEVLGAYGKSLADAGRLQEAADVLPRAHTPDRPNWSILSAQGSVADQLGDHQGAQAFYNAALKIAPNQPQVLSNLGLSYALSKQLPLAEATLQTAAAQPAADTRVRQNLALVLALEGKFGPAQQVAQRDLPPLEAAENVASIKTMIAQSDTWKDVRKADRQMAQGGVSRRGPSVAQAASPAKHLETAAED
jgi:Flp pilus assembly protein TadD